MLIWPMAFFCFIDKIPVRRFMCQLMKAAMTFSNNWPLSLHSALDWEPLRSPVGHPSTYCCEMATGQKNEPGINGHLWIHRGTDTGTFSLSLVVSESVPAGGKKMLWGKHMGPTCRSTENSV